MNAERADASSAQEHATHPHEQWDELAVGYAMSSLEPDELERFVDHLMMTCPQCLQSVTDMSELGASMGSAVTGTIPEPSAGLRDSVMAAAFAERPVGLQDSATIADAISAPAAERPAPPPVDELAARRTRHLSARVGWLTAAAAAVVALVLSVTTATALHSRNQQSALANNYDRALSAIAGGGAATTVPLADKSGQNIATVIARSHNVTIVTKGVKPNSPATSYVLWGMMKRNGTPVALGDFDLSKGQVHSVQVASDARGAYTSMQMFGLSIEPGHTPPPKPSSILALGER